jgi:site-specific DNA recombinase
MSQPPMTLHIIPNPPTLTLNLIKPIETRVFGYIRVSTFRQIDNHSLVTQESQIKDYCKNNKLTLQRIYRDEGLSGIEMYNRPGLTNLLSDVRPGDVYIIPSLSRLGRSMINNMTIFNRMNYQNCRLIILDMFIDTKTQMGKYIFGMISLGAENERDMISKRTSDVLLKMSAEGTLRRRPGFGYKIQKDQDDKKNNKRVENPEEQKIISYIRQIVLDFPEIRVCDLIKILKSQNITLRKGKLHHQTITDILEDEDIRDNKPIKGCDNYNQKFQSLLTKMNVSL